jgi:hypothetical protein
MTVITLSLVSHTNVGKTTLARTLLGREIGEVRDAPHVTEFAEGHTLLESAGGDMLRLWDTPGFGDSVRLAERMRRAGSPIGWLLTQVWDRWRDRPFWASQQALRHVQAETDVVLYLVNASEQPAAAGYVDPEMEILAWMGKPVLVLLNQLGAPRPAAEEDAELATWRMHLQRWPLVRGVLPMDAFARCWVQEGALLDAIGPLLDGERGAAMERLAAAWRERRREVFERSIGALAASLGRIAAARVALDAPASVSERWKRFAATIGWPRNGAGTDDLTQQALAAALDAEVRDSMAVLIALHGLQGDVQGELLARLADHVERHEPVSEGRAAVLGGAITGALAGLKADVATGGLTLGGGLLAGGLLGALGAAGVARGINRVRGADRAWASWSAAALTPMVGAALRRYLAVAHFGRGRGAWVEGEAPPHWAEVIRAALAPHDEALAALWKSRAPRFDAEDDAPRLAASLEPILRAAAVEVLARLYPGARAALA